MNASLIDCRGLYTLAGQTPDAMKSSQPKEPDRTPWWLGLIGLMIWTFSLLAAADTITVNQTPCTLAQALNAANLTHTGPDFRHTRYGGHGQDTAHVSLRPMVGDDCTGQAPAGANILGLNPILHGQTFAFATAAPRGYSPKVLPPGAGPRPMDGLLRTAAHAEGSPMPADAWPVVRQTLAHARLKARPTDAGGYVLRNDPLGLALHLAPDGAAAAQVPATGDRVALRLHAINGRAVGQPQSVTAEGAAVHTQWSDSVRERWINSAERLEQWFDIASPQPRAAGAGAGAGAGSGLALRINVETALKPRLSGEGESAELLLADASGATRMRYSGLKVWDAEGRMLPARMRLQGRALTLAIDDAGARYPVTVDPVVTQEAYVKASNTGAYDNFGYSVAISGDTVVVGAFGEASNATGVGGSQADNSASFAGAAYVFTRSGSTWSQQAYLKASNTGANDYFGYSVAISGDTVVVGAFGEDSNATGVGGSQADNSASFAGAAYLFTRSGSTWSQQAYLKASNTGAYSKIE